MFVIGVDEASHVARLSVPENFARAKYLKRLTQTFNDSGRS
jgi:hypothetical protein